MKFATFVPEGDVRGCVIWLSGLTCTDENFITKAGAQKYLAEKGLMVLCPDTSPRGLQLPHEHETDDFGSGASFYVDATSIGYRDHYRMESYISDELWTLIQKQFQVPQHKISIMGHSMGGHGALTIGLRHPKKFRSISAMSPIANPSRSPWGRKALAGYLGEDENKWRAHDATYLIEDGARHPATIRVDQGTEDSFLKQKQLLPENLEAACAQAGQSLLMNRREGYDHSYYFIATWIESHLQHHAEALAKADSQSS
jgi:S-formylglutathione hydrolase